MKTLSDLAYALASRGVYVVEHARLDRDVFRHREDWTRRCASLRITVPLACCLPRNSSGGRAVVCLGRELEPYRTDLNMAGIKIVQLGSEWWRNFNGICSLIEEIVLGISREDLLKALHAGKSLRDISDSSGLSEKQLKCRLKKYVGTMATSRAKQITTTEFRENEYVRSV